jgi:hypothetical protein
VNPIAAKAGVHAGTSTAVDRWTPAFAAAFAGVTGRAAAFDQAAGSFFDKAELKHMIGFMESIA